MSWQSESQFQQISDGKTEVYKICGIDKNGKLYSFFYPKFEYTLHKTYETNLDIQQHFDGFEGYNGFHSYSYTLTKYNIYKRDDYISISHPSSNQVFAWYMLSPFLIGRTIAIVKGYIPNNAIYYINEKGEVISNQIVLTEIVQKLKFNRY